ncbi:MAG: hypothetical protein JW712_06560 [Dehalococcoidales bacterium]|nr:hypothetical protein [Dehalococcoidales bacterium]
MVTEHLIHAICSLPKTEKNKVIEELLKDIDYRSILSDMPIKLLTGSQFDRNTFSVAPQNKVNHSKGRKERGKQLRQNYIESLLNRGIFIKQLGSVWAQTRTGLEIAIPVASMSRPGRWFLGLSKDKIQDKLDGKGVIIILLCQTSSDDKFDFILPVNLTKSIIHHLSESKGQYKFNVKTKDERYYLVLNDTADIDITSYKGNITVLK